MRRKQLAKRVAVAMLSASMALSAAPATAVFASVPTSGAVTYEETAQYDHNDQIEKDLASVMGVDSTATKFFGTLTDSSTADDVANALQNGLGASYTVAADTAITKGDADASGFTPLTATYTIKKNGGATVQYEITVKAKSDAASYINNATRADDISKDVVKYLATYKEFAATGDISSADVVAAVSTYLNAANYSKKSELDAVYGGSKISYRTVTVDNASSTESTTSTRGSVVGKITFTFPAHKALYETKTEKDKTLTDTAPSTTATPVVAAEDAVSVTVDFTSQRAFADETLSNTDATTIANYLAGQDFQNGADAATVTARANAYIKQLSTTGTDTQKAKWRGVTASVSGIIKQDPQAHGASANGTFSAKLTLTKGNETANADITNAKYVHSDSEKLDEVDAAITKASTDFSTAKYQRANATTAATGTDVSTAVTKVLTDALDSKVNNVALTKDGWDKTAKGTSNADGLDITVIDTTDTTASAKAADWEKKAKENKGPQRITAKVMYTPATVSAEGKAEVTVTSYIVDSEAKALAALAGKTTTDDTKNDALTKTTTFTLTFSKLKSNADTYLNFSQGSYTKAYDPEASETENTFKFGDTEDTSIPTLQRDGNDEIEWSSSDPSVAYVDQKGNVTLKGVGTAVITVTDKTNSQLSASITINSDDKYVFEDVQNPKAYYYDAVKSAYTTVPQVTAGVSDTEFGVNQKVTRGQFITWLYRAAGEPKVATSNKFSDVASTAYYAKAVAWGVSEGIVAGTSDTTFAPNDVVTREQAATFLYRAYGNGEKYTAPVNFFTDVNPDSYAYNAIIWAYENNVTNGKSVSSFAPKDEVMRTDGITFVWRANRGFTHTGTRTVKGENGQDTKETYTYKD